MLNLVRPGERVGYQKVIDRFFSETGLAFSHDNVVKPPDKAAFNRARQKIPVKVCQILFAEAVAYAHSLARQQDKLTRMASGSMPLTALRKTCLPATS